jgi:hypothetical protein
MECVGNRKMYSRAGEGQCFGKLVSTFTFGVCDVIF